MAALDMSMTPPPFFGAKNSSYFQRKKLLWDQSCPPAAGRRGWPRRVYFARAAGDEIIIRAALFRPAKVFKTGTLRGITSPDTDIVQLTFTGFEEFKINLAAISREDRDPLLQLSAAPKNKPILSLRRSLAGRRIAVITLRSIHRIRRHNSYNPCA